MLIWGRRCSTPLNEKYFIFGENGAYVVKKLRAPLLEGGH